MTSNENEKSDSMIGNNETQFIGFSDFARRIMPDLSLGSFHESYYRVLQAFAERRIRRLIVTVPPQHGKSLGASQLLPAYMLGCDPDLRIAIASYSSSLANRFNKRVQRIIDSAHFGELFPETAIKQRGDKSSYVRTSDHVEIIDRKGELMSVGREGSLTGNRVDIFILDDLYKDAMEANSPVIRENCWEWYVSVARTRQHNDSSELIVFTRWHTDDLIGRLAAIDEIIELREWSQVASPPADAWLHLNFEAIKESPATGIDPRAIGEALWPERQSLRKLNDNRRLDPHRFECLYQGRPTSETGLLYGNNFVTYTSLPDDIIHWGNYTDTADTGDDYLCSVCYAVDGDRAVYLTDIVYSREPMEITEGLVSDMLERYPACAAMIESNNGGRGFARAISRRLPRMSVEWFHQSANKEARILSNAPAVVHNIRMPAGWTARWSEFAVHLTTYQRRFRSNRWHDAADVLTGIIEREYSDAASKKIKSMFFK